MTQDRLGEILARHTGREGPLLPILHDVQRSSGCVAPEDQRVIAKALGLSRAEVHGVVSFYHDFTETPDPRPWVELCRGEAWRARGGEARGGGAERAAGDRVRLATVYCPVSYTHLDVYKRQVHRDPRDAGQGADA